MDMSSDYDTEIFDLLDFFVEHDSGSDWTFDFSDSSSSVSDPMKSKPAQKAKAKTSRKTVMKLPLKTPSSSIGSMIDFKERLARMSRSKRRAAKLSAVFPSFSKCNTLMYFPYSFATFMNTGDFGAMHNLLTSHVALEGKIYLNHSYFKVDTFTCKTFVNMFQTMQDLKPDSIACVHGMKVENNQITSSLYVKFTDCKAIFQSVMSSKTIEPAVAAMWSPNRVVALKRIVAGCDKPQEEIEKMNELVEMDGDYTVNLRVKLKITINDLTKMIDCLQMEPMLLSLEKVNYSS